jgi:hypothetical protein
MKPANAGFKLEIARFQPAYAVRNPDFSENKVADGDSRFANAHFKPEISAGKPAFGSCMVLFFVYFHIIARNGLDFGAEN